MPAQVIKISGARQHNLKNLHVELPRERLVVITGLSGSGKSSLAFDTLYAEGQRRYVESLSAYARQFLDQMEKPDVDFIEGLSPAIAIEQRSAGANPRSTIATTTEIYDYLRVLFSAVGQPHDPRTGKPIHRQTTQQIVDRILAYEAGSKIIVLAPLIRGRKGAHAETFATIRREGLLRVRVDGETHEIVGVLPATLNDWRHLGPFDLFRPLGLADKERTDRASTWVRVLGRLLAASERPAKVRVLAAGVAGSDPVYEYELVARRSAQARPQPFEDRAVEVFAAAHRRRLPDQRVQLGARTIDVDLLAALLQVGHRTEPRHEHARNVAEEPERRRQQHALQAGPGHWTHAG